MIVVVCDHSRKARPNSSQHSHFSDVSHMHVKYALGGCGLGTPGTAAGHRKILLITSHLPMLGTTSCMRGTPDYLTTCLLTLLCGNSELLMLGNVVESLKNIPCYEAWARGPAPLQPKKRGCRHEPPSFSPLKT